MSVPSELAPGIVDVQARRRPLAYELAFVVIVSLVVLLPGIQRYTLVDPWETHYGEVAREMLQNNDWVHTEWRGTMEGNPNDNEGFRSKPVLQFWLMAASMTALGVADGGGYSGEMTDSPIVMVAIRLPFVLTAIAGLVLMWWMLARLVSRRMAWLALVAVGTMPMFAMIARNAIPDMLMVACTIGSLSLFALAMEDGDRPIRPLFRVRGVTIDARHVALALAGAFVFIQAGYYFVYFLAQPPLAVRGVLVKPAVSLPVMMLLGFSLLGRNAWLIPRIVFVFIGGVIAAVVKAPVVVRRPAQSLYQHVVENILWQWERHAPDRYLVRALLFPFAWIMGLGWADTNAWADRVFLVAPLTQMRQLYLIGCYFLLGVSILAKGPPGLTVVGAVGALYVLLLGRWRHLANGAFEIKRGLALVITVAIPWHVAMFYRDGVRFIDEYLFQHILNRAAVGVDNSPGSFEMYTSQIGHGMWMWAALVPPALAATFLRTRLDDRAGRVRFIVGLWSICAVGLFCLVQTKFNHYIFPALPPLAITVAFLLDDILARRERLHPLWAAFAIGAVLLMCRDLMFEPERWIEMFVYRYDRPWANGEPYAVDTSSGFLGLGLMAAAAIALLGSRFARAGVIAVATVGVCICVWALQMYMPVAARHWGMRDSLRVYYEQRDIYGQKIVYNNARQVWNDWHDVGNTWTFETFVPDHLQQGQPMTIKVVLNKEGDDRVIEQELSLLGHVSAIGAHSVTLTLAPGERDKMKPMTARGNGAGGKRVRPPLRMVEADRLIGWQLYWRGENFWSGGEIWAYLPEQKTQFNKTDNVELLKYLNDRSRAPLGRRYFVVTEGGRINGMKAVIPTTRGRETFEVLDTTSNKFAIGAFTL